MPKDKDEIEITPAMAKAGAEELSRFDPREDDLEATALLVFQAMAKARAET